MPARTVRRLGAVLVATALSATILTATPAAAATTVTGVVTGEVDCATVGGPFTDVKPKNVHCDAITYLAGAGITTPAGTRYQPAASVTRGAMTAFLSRLIRPGEALPACTAKPFPDVVKKDTFCATIAWARDAGIAGGYPDGTFRPDAPVRRGEMAIFLARAAAALAPETPDTPDTPETLDTPDTPEGPDTPDTADACTAAPFPDIGITDIACPAVTYLRDTGVTAGFPDGTFRPAPKVTRAEMASFLWRLAQVTSAPGLPATPVAPLAGATVLAVNLTGRPAIATSRADGTFTITAPGTGYRICVDASTVTRPKAEFADGCASTTPFASTEWTYDYPIGPPEAAAEPGTLLRITLAPSTTPSRRGPAVTPAQRSSSYRFMDLGTGQARVTYSPCRPIHFVMRPDGAPEFGDLLVMTAIVRLSRATGLRFIYDGTSSETPSDKVRAAYQPGRYGERWAPVLIGWSDPVENPRLAGDVVGFAGSDAQYGTVAGARVAALTTGVVVLDGPDLGGLLTGWDGDPDSVDYYVSLVVAVIMHELGHLVGLDHVDDPTQLMYPQAGDTLDFAAGDLTGLSLAGNGPCVTLPNPASVPRTARLAGATSDGIRYG